MTEGTPRTSPEHPTGPHEHGHSIYEPGEFLDAPPDEAIPESRGQPAAAPAELAHHRLDRLRAGPASSSCSASSSNVDFGEHLDAGPHRANPAFLLAAFVGVLPDLPAAQPALVAASCAHVGTRVRYGDATEILFLSWFVNCLVPAKLGDLYRAYLLRGNLRRLDLAHGRHHLHRAHRRHHRHLRPGAGRRVLELPRPESARGRRPLPRRLRGGRRPGPLRRARCASRAAV